jgi:hypothetical protein
VNSARLGLCVAVMCIHIAVVFSIAKQPLHVNAAAPEQRSLIWALHNDTVHRIGPAADFFAVYHAGAALRGGRDPYGHGRQQDLDTAPYFYQFRYLPAVAYAMGRGVAELAPRTAWWLWILTLEMLLAVVSIALLRRLPAAGWSQSLAFALLYLSSPYFLELHMGQFTFATLALLTLALLSAEGSDGSPLRRRLASAGCLSASILLKPVALASLPALLRHREQWTSIGVALALVVATSVPYFALHPEQWRTFAELNLASPFGGMHPGNHGLLYLVFMGLADLGVPADDATWSLLLPPWRAAWLGVSAILVVASRCERIVVGGATMILAHFLGFAHVWEHHMSGLLPLGVALWAVLLADDETRRGWAATLTPLALLMLALPTSYALFDLQLDPGVPDPSLLWPRYASYLNASCKVLPTLALFAVCVSVLHRSGWRIPRWVRGR